MEKKKVCVVTNYSSTSNYGALLQAYALNRVISKMGCEVKTLYIKNRGRSKKNIYFDLLKKCKWISLVKHFFVDIPEIRVRKEVLKRRRAVEDFRMSISHTDLYYTDCYDGLNESFDIFIAGSDQIFRPHAKSNRLVEYYWLDMVDSQSCIKASYAASMGVESLDEQQSEIARKYLEDFDFLSFRENVATEYFYKLTHREDIVTNVDPVFLIDREEWRNLEKEYQIEGKYLFVYMIHGRKQLMKSIVKFAQNHELEIVIFPFMRSIYCPWERDVGDVRVFDATPEQFLYLLDHAEYVFTDSFHVTAFSVIFHKRMYISHANERAFSRINNILRLFEVSGVEIPAEGIVEGAYETNTNLDWSKVDTSIRKQQLQSEEYLYKVISSSRKERS